MLELGKYYQQRNGVVVGPLGPWNPTPTGMFKNFIYHDKSLSRTWTKNGKFSLNDQDHSNDLVSEVEFKPLTEQPKEEIVSKPFKLEVGKYYEDREDEVRGPIKANDHPIYSFTDGDLIWTENGNYYEIGGSDYDLIKEVPNPNQETQQPRQEETKVKFKEITLKEALDILKSDGILYVTDSEIERQPLTRQYGIAWLLDATKFEIEVKPVVKYLVVYGDFYDYQNISSTHYSSIEDFYSDYDKSQYPLAELIQFTRKEF